MYILTDRQECFRLVLFSLLAGILNSMQAERDSGEIVGKIEFWQRTL